MEIRIFKKDGSIKIVTVQNSFELFALANRYEYWEYV